MENSNRLYCRYDWFICRTHIHATFHSWQSYIICHISGIRDGQIQEENRDFLPNYSSLSGMSRISDVLNADVNQLPIMILFSLHQSGLLKENDGFDVTNVISFGDPPETPRPSGKNTDCRKYQSKRILRCRTYFRLSCRLWERIHTYFFSLWNPR